MGAFDVGMRSSREEETKTVHDSTVTVTNVVSLLTYRMMWLHRLLSVDLVKTSVTPGLQVGCPCARIKCV